MPIGDWASLATVVATAVVVLGVIWSGFRLIRDRINHRREAAKAKRELRRSDLLNWINQLQSAVADVATKRDAGISSDKEAYHDRGK